MGFELHVANGRVAALPDCPYGWQIQVDNDPAGHATIKAIAIVGAAALDLDALQKTVLFARVPASFSGVAGQTFSVVGTAATMRNGDMSNGDLTQVVLHGLRLVAIRGKPVLAAPSP